MPSSSSSSRTALRTRRCLAARVGIPLGSSAPTRQGSSSSATRACRVRSSSCRTKFDQYLGEEGLDEIKALRARRGAKAGTAREIFSRCAKTLLLSGAGSENDRDRALGLTFEIVAEHNPYLSAAGRELSFALTYEGKPRAGALVIALNQRDPSKKLSARSDNQGRVAFRFPTGGVWLVKAVHMIPAKPGTNADWESYWASLTFDLAEAHVPTLTR